MKGCGSLIALGGITVSVPAAFGASYLAEQDVIAGTVTTTLTGAGVTGSLRFTSFVHPQDNVLVTEITYTPAGSVAAGAAATTSGNLGEATVVIDVTTWVLVGGGLPVAAGATNATRPVMYATRKAVADTAASAKRIVATLATGVVGLQGPVAAKSTVSTTGMSVPVSLQPGSAAFIVTYLADNVDPDAPGTWLAV